MLERRTVDVAVLDIHLGDGNGLDLIPTAKEQGTRCLAYTGLVDNEAVQQAREAGADGLAAKAGSPRELSAAVKTVAAGDTYFDQRFAAGDPPERKRSLTPREAEVVGLLAEGLTGEEIAERLFLSPATVRTHIRNAMDRLGARTRAHLVTLADRRR
jgi:DNA-binding NarL/FixJ family response regulator